MYEYRAKVTKVYDGDTITVDIDLGLGVWLKGQTLRLYAVNTPELHGAGREEGLQVRDWLREKVLFKDITIETVKDRTGKYGRWLALVRDPGSDSTINQQLIEQGYPAPKGWL